MLTITRKKKLSNHFVLIKQPAFIRACMNQSQPLSGLNNTLTLRLEVNELLAAQVRWFTISTLTGAVVSTPRVLLSGAGAGADLFCVDGEHALASWQAHEVNLYVCTDGEGIEAYTAYGLSWGVQNQMCNLYIKYMDHLVGLGDGLRVRRRSMDNHKHL